MAWLFKKSQAILTKPFRKTKDLSIEHYHLPGDLEREIEDFVTHYNERRYHESLNNLTPEEILDGRGQATLDGRRKIKEKTLKRRWQLYYQRKSA